MSSQERSKRVYELFTELLDGVGDERKDVLARIAAESPTLAGELSELLRSQEAAPQSFLRYGVMSEPATTDEPLQIGGYRVVGELGRGGMGIVFDAEQEEPRRRVALKVVPSGAHLEPTLVRRFQRESRVLARLQHPAIAQIYEAGTAKVGLAMWPYFAMERIDGEQLNDWLDRQPPMESRLQLFAEVCDAIQHAHQNHVLHRDIKPNNIMVVPGNQPGSFRPKVLDFGVALPIDDQGRDRSFVTHSGHLMGTVAFMSPEQMGGESNALDARSDVYALGVLLYWLLTRRLPLPVSDRPIHVAAQIIRLEEPIQLRSIDPTISSELGTIVHRALEKAPSRRYPTAASLGEDVRRFLRNEPVMARDPSTWYLAAKFARRNRGLVAGVTATFLALVFGLVTTNLAFLEAVRERDRAESALHASDAMSNFLTDVLASSDSWSNGVDVKVRDIIEPAAASISARFSDLPLTEARLHSTVGRVYLSLGLHERAVHHLELASERFDGLTDVSVLDRMLVSTGLGQSLIELGRFDDGRVVLEKAYGLLAPQFEPEDPQLLPLLNVLASLRLILGDESSALLLIEDAERRASYYDDFSQPEVIELLFNRAFYHRRRSEPQLAYDYLENLYRAVREGHGSKFSSVQRSVVAERLGTISRALGQTDRALALHQEAQALQLQELGPAHQFTILSTHQYARTLAKAGRIQEGLIKIGQVSELLEKDAEAQGLPFLEPTVLLNARARLLARIPERRQEAEKVLRTLIARYQEELGEKATRTQKIRGELVTLLLRDQRYEEAKTEVDILLVHLRAKYPEGASSLEAALAQQADAVARLGIRSKTASSSD